MTLKQAWEKRKKLRVEGHKLYAEGRSFYAKGYKLYAEGNKLRAEGDIIWLDTVIDAYGKNAIVEWQSDGSCKITANKIEIFS